MLGSVFTKLHALGVPAKATVLGVALALGAAGAVAYANEYTEPEQTVLDDGTDGGTEGSGTEGSDTEGSDTEGSGTEGSGTEEPTDTDGPRGHQPKPWLPESAQFGQWVASQARNGGVDGQEVSQAARARNELRKAERENGDTRRERVRSAQD
jgi:hypothetical protein